ncbi:BspA family leucine-rich repeat surface protein [Helicobacter cynogastricus]|uniref:BspA family leucine-rich repeat surface protein n=1 Tax=Helicobacter cynogastricus TaxID=329937 RepID=UPI000CF0D35E|nr:BspA family leucine-rich repeat surface protein [Helicobacter cynogastricus]
MQQVLEKLEQEIKSVKRACRLGKGVLSSLESGLELKQEVYELHTKFSALRDALTHLIQTLDQHYANLEDDLALEEILILFRCVRAKIDKPLDAFVLVSNKYVAGACEDLENLEGSVLELEKALDNFKAYQKQEQLDKRLLEQLGDMMTALENYAQMTKKHFPQSKEELKKLVADESVHLGGIDISKITDLSYVFSHVHEKDKEDFDPSDDEETLKSFNRRNFEGLETWDTSHVTNMKGMFYRAIHFNHDISSWDVSSVEDMELMFENCESFNQSLNDWDVSRVRNMRCMFSSCQSFNQPLNAWDVSSVTNMYSMFDGCTSFNQPLENWDVSKVESMNWMFEDCQSFNQFLDSWKISSVKSMIMMFENCSSLAKLPTWYKK